MISVHPYWLFGFLFSEKERDAMTQPKTDLAYLRNEKAKAEQKLRACQHAPLQNKEPNNQTCFATDCLARKSVYGFGGLIKQW